MPAGRLAGMARLKLTIVLASGARMGPGKAALLESVRDTGSIAAAARAMGMDYKRAWLLIDSLNRAFDTQVVERTAGGPGGGGATLTLFGEELLARYRRLEQAAAELAAEDLAALERRAWPEAGPKV
jgi:molybdate transport system regulatory protein